ncbi:hypothetical protein [Yersinia enterocolitica]|uniref:hypothetical protein n=1 Tax=Yersinia enterocolitica TaxID=630 RepID=UPI001C60A000|nr:hypothetical protein [Yersinia enterocolitica]EKN4799385.1 hypothetical protein [Yersinia enterocolitica]MBW5823422.1 hypothetical protein [Yersinia enterocolitica]MBW5869593.1 hypothetical protein [Yersinia enterocolitica]MBW5877101.1 hypothetical protein [Yersinia enterocolitica]
MKPSPQCCCFSHKAQPQNLSELKALIESEIADFMAGLDLAGESTEPELMQQALLRRIDTVFDFYITQKPER